LASLDHRDFDVGSHGGLFDDRRLALANSCATATDGSNRQLKALNEFLSCRLGKSEMLRKKVNKKTNVRMG
jgi:hypothetical protein